MKVAVLGAGIAGVMTAYFLADDGHEVVVLDRAAEAASETSHANGGAVGATQVEPWAQPGLPRQILGWIGNNDAPLLLRLDQLPRMYRWGLRFLRRCTDAAFSEALETNTRLTLYSLALFARLREALSMTGAEYDLNRSGALKVYFTPESFSHAETLARSLAGFGALVETVDARRAVALEPALAPGQAGICGALHFPREEVGDCRMFAVWLAEACRRRGVTFRHDVSVHRLACRGGRVAAAETSEGPVTADRFVAALGSFTPLLLRSAGIRAPIIPVKGVTITVPAAPWKDAVRMSVMDHSRLYGLMRIGDRLRISGSAEIAGYDAVPSPARCEALVRNVTQLFPGFSACLAAAEPVYWAGLRPVTPDGAPILGATPIANLFINSGHGPQGWSTSCGSARIVADVVAGGTPAISLRGLTFDRFA
jgi:D-amino-acid dehydrogenase